MAPTRRTLLSHNVNIFADGRRMPIPGAPPELVLNPLHELTPPNRQALRLLRLPALRARTQHGLHPLSVHCGKPRHVLEPQSVGVAPIPWTVNIRGFPVPRWAGVSGSSTPYLGVMPARDLPDHFVSTLGSNPISVAFLRNLMSCASGFLPSSSVEYT